MPGRAISPWISGTCPGSGARGSSRKFRPAGFETVRLAREFRELYSHRPILHSPLAPVSITPTLAILSPQKLTEDRNVGNLVRLEKQSGLADRVLLGIKGN